MATIAYLLGRSVEDVRSVAAPDTPPDATQAVVSAARELIRIESTGVLPDFMPLAKALDALATPDTPPDRCPKCGLPPDAHPGQMFCPAPGAPDTRRTTRDCGRYHRNRTTS